VRRWFRQQEREKNISQGRDIVTRELKRLGLLDTFSIDDIALALNFDDLDAFLAAIGFGDLQTVQIGGAIAKLRQKLKPDDDLFKLLAPKEEAPRSNKGLTVRGLSGLHTRMAGCCNPIPPEPIVGYITRGSGVTIHSADCKTMLSITERERLIEVAWGQEQETYPIPVVIESFRHSQLAEEISKILHGRNLNVTKTKSVTVSNQTTVYLVVEVATLDDLDWTLRKLESLPTVYEVRRQRWAG
jgi:GTP pyrophosphokinase